MKDAHQSPQEDTNKPLTLAQEEKAIQSFRLSRMILPIAIGVAAVVWLFYRNFDAQQFRSIQWTGKAFLWIAAAFVLLIFRHLSYAFRIKNITGNVFSWKKCIELIVIWEFSAALTPTSKGGPLVMLFALAREKVPPGKTAVAILYTMVLDSGFFTLMLPFMLMFFGPSMVFPGMTDYNNMNVAGGAFFVTYSLIAIYWSCFAFFLFIRPQLGRAVLHAIARLPFLKNKKAAIESTGDDFVTAATELRQWHWQTHVNVILGTIGAWTSKFFMINFLMLAVAPHIPLDGSTQLFVYGRLVAMFVVMTFSPTPGGAGLAEIALAEFISDFVPKGIGLVVALLWRLMAYYGYLLVGAFVVPAWIARTAVDNHKDTKVLH